MKMHSFFTTAHRARYAVAAACWLTLCGPLSGQETDSRMPAEIISAQKAYNDQLAAAENKFRNFEALIIADYDKLLKSAEEKYISSGNLDGVLSVKK